MTPYANLDGDSGVVAYEISPDGIILEFRKGGRYRYAAADIGTEALATMIELAEAGRGLSTYVTKNRQAVYAKGVKV